MIRKSKDGTVYHGFANQEELESVLTQTRFRLTGTRQVEILPNPLPLNYPLSDVSHKPRYVALWYAQGGAVIMNPQRNFVVIAYQALLINALDELVSEEPRS